MPELVRHYMAEHLRGIESELRAVELNAVVEGEGEYSSCLSRSPARSPSLRLLVPVGFATILTMRAQR
jgi:hypothetical protein